MPSKVTFSGKIGPGQTVTSMVLDGVKELHLDFVHQTAKVVYVGTAGRDTNLTVDLSLYEVTTFTDTISNRDHTIVMS